MKNNTNKLDGMSCIVGSQKTVYIEQDGKKVNIEVSDELYEEMTRMRREKWRNDKRYFNHNFSLEERMEQGCDIEDDSQNPEVLLIDRPADEKEKALRLKKMRLAKLSEGMKMLTDKQASAIHKRFFLEMTFEEIAEEEGVCINAIVMRIEGALKKLKKFFKNIL